MTPEILFISSFPPRECGIATYTQDLIVAIQQQFNDTFNLSVCALESNNEKHEYNNIVDFLLNTDDDQAYQQVAQSINLQSNIQLIVVQHEFGFFHHKEVQFIDFLQALNAPIVLVFHTVLTKPNEKLKANVLLMSLSAAAIVVMTNTSSNILIEEYQIPTSKINVIAHGTHLMPHNDKEKLKSNYGFEGKQILSTFGLLSAGKSIETTLNAMPEIIANHPDVLFLIIGKTHPTIVKHEGEHYRNKLVQLVNKLNLQQHVMFINKFVALPILLQYLQLTDIYLFTSNDPNQAVSGTFSYAVSSGCPVISTPIPHSLEVLGQDAGIMIDFENSTQLAKAVDLLLSDATLRETIRSNALHLMAVTAWENSANKHALLFQHVLVHKPVLNYKVPPISLQHVLQMTNSLGMIQFAKLNQPDLNSGYALDDNARALICICKHYQLYENHADLALINTYFNFIKYCFQHNHTFLNYVDKEGQFTSQNHNENLEDSNGRAIWALGYLISIRRSIPSNSYRMIQEAENLFNNALMNVHTIHSTRAMAFVIKGIYYAEPPNWSKEHLLIITTFADRLVQMYLHESDNEWHWFESYLTYANSVVPEALLCASIVTGNYNYQQIAKKTFDFLLAKTFRNDQIQLISNTNWLHKNSTLSSSEIAVHQGGQQPIDVAYTMMALDKFYVVFHEPDYRLKMRDAFNWFLGNNHLHQMIYNRATGGCYDGLEQQNINLNQGAESTLSYLLARLTIENFESVESNIYIQSNEYDMATYEQEVSVSHVSIQNNMMQVRY